MASFTSRTYRIMNMLNEKKPKQCDKAQVSDTAPDNNLLLLNIPEVTDSLFTDDLEPTILNDITAEVLNVASEISGLDPHHYHNGIKLSIPDENFQLFQSSYSKERVTSDKHITDGCGAAGIEQDVNLTLPDDGNNLLQLNSPREYTTSGQCSPEDYEDESELDASLNVPDAKLQFLLSYPEENGAFVKCSTAACSEENDLGQRVGEGQSDCTNDPDYVSDSKIEDAVRNTRTSDTTASSDKKRNKRHFVDERKWKHNDRKRKREKGEEYCGRKKVAGKFTYDIKKGKKVLQPPCNCKLSLQNTVLKCWPFSEVDRQNIFTNFWTNMGWSEQKVYVTMLVDSKSIKRHRNQLNETSTRTQSLVYHMKKGQDRVRVCKQMFLNTHSFKDNMILDWLKKQMNHESIIDSREESINASKGNTKIQRYQGLKENLKTFFNKLPKVESHYCRSSSSKLYLEPNYALWSYGLF